jgi:hypothetical protein
VQQFERARRSDGVGHGPDGGRVLQVAPGGRVDEQQVVTYEGGEHRHVLAVEADPGRHVLGDDLAGDGVVARPALADVVQQRGDEQEVGPVDPAGHLGCLDRGLDEVPVDGPDVHGVALRSAAHPLPVRQQVRDEALGLQRLPDVDGRAAGTQQGDELLARLGGPGRRQRAGGGRHPSYGVQGERQSGLGGRGGGAQGQHGVPVGLGGPREHDLAVLLDHALGQRRPLRGGLPAAEHGAQPWPDGA